MYRIFLGHVEVFRHIGVSRKGRFCEGERVSDHDHLTTIFIEYKRIGFKTAIDDFGAGYSGLNRLAEFQPDYIKLDIALTRNIDKDLVRRAIHHDPAKRLGT